MSDDKEQIKICKGDCHLSWNQWFKRGTFFVFAVILILTTVFFLSTLYEGKTSVESVLSVILALFSMSMSAFFYFKADEAGKNFYKSSYKFMKKQSQFLGEMNVRFGEKFENLTTHVRDLQVQKSAVVERIQEHQTNTQENSENMMTTLKSQNEEYKTLIERLEKELSEKATVNDENRELKELLESARSKEDEFKEQIKLHERKLRFFTKEKETLENDLEKFSSQEELLSYAKNATKMQARMQAKIQALTTAEVILNNSVLMNEEEVHRLLTKRNCKHSAYFTQMLILGYCYQDGELTEKGFDFLSKKINSF